MGPRINFALIIAASLLELAPLALAHGHDNPGGDGMDVGAPSHASLVEFVAHANMSASSASPQSYFSLPQDSNLILGHIVLMTLAWFFVLPIGEQRPTIAESVAEILLLRCYAERRSLASRFNRTDRLLWYERVWAVTRDDIQQQDPRPL